MKNPLNAPDIDGNTLNLNLIQDSKRPDSKHYQRYTRFDEEYNFKECNGCDTKIPMQSDYCDKCWRERNK